MAENIREIHPNVPSIVVDDGTIEVPVKNRQGEQVGLFRFRPTDMGMADRFNELAEGFDKIVEPLKNVNIDNNGKVDSTDEAALAAMREAEERLYAGVNKLFGGNMAEAFFGHMAPFSPINGHFYVENALEAVGKFIEGQFNREVKKVSSRVERYTHGYQARSGKHRNGRK